MKTLILGLGSPTGGNEAVGLAIAESLRPLLDPHGPCSIDIERDSSLKLLERLVGHERVVLIDTVRASRDLGGISFHAFDSVPFRPADLTHGVDLAIALSIGRRAGLKVPASKNVYIFAVEIGRETQLDAVMDTRVAAAIRPAVEDLLERVRIWQGGPKGQTTS